jgi:hypothetical protein
MLKHFAPFVTDFPFQFQLSNVFLESLFPTLFSTSKNAKYLQQAGTKAVKEMFEMKKRQK